MMLSSTATGERARSDGQSSSLMIRTLARRLPFYYGWVIVGCVMGSNVVRQAAAVMTLSIFFVPMTDELGWSRTEISSAPALGVVLGALVAPFIGPLFDRHGSRALLVTSAVAVSACCLALAGTQGLLWFCVAISISGLMYSALFEIGTTSAVTTWFVRRRARAMSLLITSIGVGAAVFPLVAEKAIDVYGWRAGWLVLAAVVIGLGVLPQWLLLVRRPEDIGLEPDGTTTGEEPTAPEPRPTGAGEIHFTRAEALRSPALWLLMAYTLLVFPAVTGMGLHLKPYLMECGISSNIAARIVSAASVAFALSSLLLGSLGERAPVRATLAASAALVGLGVATMLGVEGPLLGTASAVLFGAGTGGVFIMVPVAWAKYFGRAHFGAIRGVTLPAQVAGQATGLLAAGHWHDLTGSYASVLTAFAVLSLLAAGVALLARAPARPATGPLTFSAPPGWTRPNGSCCVSRATA